MRVPRRLQVAALIAIGVGCSGKEDPAPEGPKGGGPPGPPVVIPAGPLQPVLGPLFQERPSEADVIASSPNYNDTAVGEAERVLTGLAPEVKTALLGHLKNTKKLSAVKELRADSGSGLLVAKLAVELLAVRNGVNPGILKPEAR